MTRIESTGPTAISPSSELGRASDQLTSGGTPGSSGYKIGPQDVLEITVFKVPELSKILQVADNGSINMPLIGEVRAAGRTSAEIERELQAKLGAKYVKSPQVSVYVKEFNSQRLTVEGAVKKPGVYPFRGQDTLLQAIAKAEGIDRDVSSGSVAVFRTINGQRYAVRYDVDSIRAGQAPDPQLQSGDVVVVGDSASKSAFQTVVKLLPLTAAAALLR